MIRAKDISKMFGDLRVLSGVNLHIKKGSIYGLAGRSGAGKSTFLRCINGLEPYDSGALLVDGVEVNRLKETELREFRKNVGMVFQNFSLLERLSVYENVALPLRCWKYKTAIIDKKVREFLGLVGLSQKIKQKPRELSGGQKQRVAIARALSLEPDILLCDEATSALDPKTAQEILSLLRTINSQMGITIIMVSHQMSVLSSTCDEMAILENGRVDSQGPVKQLIAQQPLSLRNLLGDACTSLPTPPQTITICLPSGTELAAQMAIDLGIELTIVGGTSAGSLPLLRFLEKDYEIVTGYISEKRLTWYPTNSKESPLQAAIH